VGEKKELKDHLPFHCWTDCQLWK